MKTIIFGALAAATMAIVIPASVQQADAQPAVREKVVVRHGMDRHHRCFTERTRVHRPGGRVIIKTRRVCR